MNVINVINAYFYINYIINVINAYFYIELNIHKLLYFLITK